MKTVLIVITAALLYVMSTRLGVDTLIMVMNQRPLSRSNRIWGSEVPDEFLTDWKKVSVVAFSTPSALPVALSKDLIRPLTTTTYWLGPTVPMESGGMKPESDNWAPRNLVPVVCAARGPA